MTDTVWAFAGTTSRRRGRPPASDSAVTRERILQAARKVFAEAGYEAATFQAIASEIGLTRPAINNYFPSKSALYAEVAERAGTAVAHAVRRASAVPDLPGQLIAFLRHTVRGDGNSDGGGSAEPALAGFLVQAAIEAPGSSHAHAGSVAGHVERFVSDAVDQATRRGELSADTDTAAVTDALTGLLWGSAFQMSRGLQLDTPRTERLLDQLESLLQSA